MMRAVGRVASRVASRARSIVTHSPSVTAQVKPEAVGKTMPPGYQAKVGQLDTFVLPDHVAGSSRDIRLGQGLVDSWRRNGIFQIAMDYRQRAIYEDAQAASKTFFAKPLNEKQACVSSQSYAGYIASGEEITNGVADYSEIFTWTRDSPLWDARVRQGWPCWGTVPWPDYEMQAPMERYLAYLGQSGEKLLALVELGLKVPRGSLTSYTKDGWHHMRILRFPPVNNTNGKGKLGRGIGSHTDYGLLVIAAQDDVGGLFIRPPYEGEDYANWNQSTAGLKEDDHRWVYVPPVEGVFTVFPGDMMQYMTNSYLPSTLHKVGLNTRDRYAFAYFHEPSYQAVCKPLPGYNKGQEPQGGLHYGRHFTDMFMRNYPSRITTQRILREKRYARLAEPALSTMPSMSAANWPDLPAAAVGH